MLEVGSVLPALRLLGEDERETPLDALHRDAPLAAIFLRHFG